MSASQPANVHQLRIGGFILSTLLEAQVEASFDLPRNIDETTARRLHAESRRPAPPRVTINVYLLDTGDHRILIDTGFGGLAEGFTPNLMDNLATLGLVPSDIDTVLITHAHGDHVGGLIDANDDPAFPRATVLVPAGELDYWGGAVPEGISQAERDQFQAAHRVIAAVGPQMQHLEGTEVLPGITRVPLPGHTPDHSGYRIESGHDRMLLWADVVHLPQIQFPCPAAGVAFDSDVEQAHATRRTIMAELAESQELVGGHHLDFPGISHVVADGDGYRFVPHVWQPTV